MATEYSIYRMAVLLALASFANACAVEERVTEKNEIPAAVLAVFEKAESIEIHSLEPSDFKKEKEVEFREGNSLGKVVVKGADATALVKALKDSAAVGKGPGAKCFFARHGLKTISSGKTATIEICFECNWAYPYVDGARANYFYPGKPLKTALNKILEDAKVRQVGDDSKF